MPARAPESSEFRANIICPKCGAVGVVVWENYGGARSLVSLSNGFYERLAKKPPHSIELVCQECGAGQPQQEA